MPWLSVQAAGILAQSRALCDWHNSNLHCGKCGSTTFSIEGGGKRKCSAPSSRNQVSTHISGQQDGPAEQTITSTTAATAPAPKSSNPSPTEQHQIRCGRTVYARTDPVVIALIISANGENVLLSRKKEFPKGVYTCVAGFLEGGESLEEGVRREVDEETGVSVGAVKYFASQPWPFLGGQLMIGCFGVVKDSDASSAQVTLHDGELEDARWFSRDEIGNMLDVSRDNIDAWINPMKLGSTLRVPPPFAIAYQLILQWYLNKTHKVGPNVNYSEHLSSL
jgi:NAD+ diphosphatase